MSIEPALGLLDTPYLREIAGLVAISLTAILFRDFLMWLIRTIISKLRETISGASNYSVEDKELRKNWIAQGIDPVIKQLDDQAWLFTPSDNPLPTKVYQTVNPIEYSESVLYDLENHGYNVREELEEYNNKIEKYTEKRSSLKTKLQTHFHKNDDHLLRSLSTVKNKNHAGKVAEAVLIASNPKRSVGQLTDNEELVKAVTPTLRAKPKFEDEFVELDELTEDIQKKRKELSERFSSIRDELIETYDISETGIDQLKDESN